MQKINILWFRRDLRLHDNAGLYHALNGNYPVLPVFIFDKMILEKLEEKKDNRIEFIRDALVEMQSDLEKIHSSLEVLHATPEAAFKKLLQDYDVQAVFTNHDYEPYAIERDDLIKNLLDQKSIKLISYKDQVIFEKDEVMKEDGKPYTVFTPYSNKWKRLLTDFYYKSYPVHKYAKNFFKQPLH